MTAESTGKTHTHTHTPTHTHTHTRILSLNRSHCELVVYLYKCDMEQTEQIDARTRYSEGGEGDAQRDFQFS